MNVALPRSLIVLTVLCLARPGGAAPEMAIQPQQVVVTARDYRVAFSRFRGDFRLELRDRAGQWRPVTKKKTSPEFGISDATGVHTNPEAPAAVRQAKAGEAIVVGMTTILPTAPPTVLRVHFLCHDEGLLLHVAPHIKSSGAGASCWAMPRLALDETLFDAYAYCRAGDELRSGRIEALGTPTVYAGVSPWGRQGDTAPGLSARHPAVMARSESAGLALGVVLLDYEARWTHSHSFLQRYDRQHLFLYAGTVGLDAAANGLWGWLAPMPTEPSAGPAKVERLLGLGKELAAGFQPLAPQPEEHWTRPLPDFPAALRRARPVADIREAIVYTIHETILADDGVELARKTGSDLLIRAWFKWATPPDYTKLAPHVPKAHAMGALFGGGITCSALYHGENGLSDQQVLDMATRGPQGQLVDAWNEPRCRHGSLSNPAYLEYLLGSCKRQIDCGADYLFMDEINAALQADEGFDDSSIADFRKHLLDRYSPQSWAPADARWREKFHIDLADRSQAPDGTMGTFQYRGYLKARGHAAHPHAPANPLAAEWHAFRDARDDRAWKWLTGAIRAHAASRGRRVLLSGNGLARYVDLQVLGVWENWQTQQGRIDLSESQLDTWGSSVAAGWAMADRKVPVVLFHDWGFGGFPWMEISPDDRRLWIRVRGAEIYAAGGFFAFPAHGPMGNDSRLDGTLGEIARQSRFYHQHQDLYLKGELLGFDGVQTEEPGLSLALWRCRAPQSLVVHVINRQVEDGKPRRRGPLAFRLPTDRPPRSVRVVSPDWPGEKSGVAKLDGGRLTVTVPEVEAYSVAILAYDELPQIASSGRRIVPSWQWARPARNEFVVREGGLIEDPWALPGMLQGQLHQHLRNPPAFVLNMSRGGCLRVHIRGVATAGAKLQWQVDGRMERVIDLPDRDGKNESMAKEYDQTFELPVPPGPHRAVLDNVGGDWACIGWYAFSEAAGR